MVSVGEELRKYGYYKKGRDTIMGKWQIVYLVMIALSLGCSLADHGKTRVKTDNFWTSLLAASIELWIVYAGGIL